MAGSHGSLNALETQTAQVAMSVSRVCGATSTQSQRSLSLAKGAGLKLSAKDKQPGSMLPSGET